MRNTLILLLVIMTGFQTVQSGKILKKLTKELKKVIGGAKFEEIFANNIADIHHNSEKIHLVAGNITSNSEKIHLVAENITSNSEKIHRVADHLANATINIANIKVDVVDNAAAISSNDADILSITNDVADNSVNIASNSDKIHHVKVDVADNAAGISNNAAKIHHIKVDVAGNSAKIATNDNDIGQNSANIASNSNKIHHVKVHVADNSARLLDLESHLSCEDNTHVNGLLSISAPEDIGGWETTCTHGNIYGTSLSTCDGNWFTFAPGSSSCFIKTTLNGNGRAKIDFGNCNYSGGVAKLFLDGNEIASAGASEVNIVKEFDFTDGSELRLTEWTYGVIIFNSFEVLTC